MVVEMSPINGLLVLCQVLELGLCAAGFASAGRQYTTLMYTGTASGTPKLSTESALGQWKRVDWRLLNLSDRLRPHGISDREP